MTMRPVIFALVAAAALSGCKVGGGAASGSTDPYAGQGSGKSKLRRFTFPDKDANQKTGVKLPPEDQATLVDREGKPASLTAWRGKPVVLVFMRGFPGFICPYCTTYTAQIATRYDEIKAAGAEVLVVYPTEEKDTDKVAEFVKACNEILTEEGEEGLAFPVLLDPGLKVVQQYNIQGDLSRPSTFVLDAEGVIRYVYVGKDSADRPSVERILEEVRALGS